MRAARALNAAVGGVIGLFGGGMQGLAQTVGPGLRMVSGLGCGGAGFGGHGVERLQRAAGFLGDGVASVGGQGLEAVQRLLRCAVEGVSFAGRQFAERLELVGGRFDQIAQDVHAARRGVGQLATSRTGGGQGFDQLSALALDLGGEVLLIGA